LIEYDGIDISHFLRELKNPWKS